MSLNERLTEAAIELEKLLEKVPEPVAREMREQIAELRELLLEQRPPRFALVGRRGAGKSSLVNAIFGRPVAEVGHEKAQTSQGTWWSYKGDLGTIDILDTRGIQEGSTPEGALEDTPVRSIVSALEEQAPDAVLFLIKAKEVDAAIEGDLDALEEISQRIHELYHFRVPIVAVITHSDELEPKNVRLDKPEEEDEEDLKEKLARVGRIEADLAQKIRDREKLRHQFVAAHAISAYQSWRLDGTRRADERWRIEELLDFLIDELPKQARVEFARLSQVKELQHRIARHLTSVVATLCAGVAVVPIPAADIIPITSMQVGLISGIGYLSGRRMELKTAGEFLGAVGANVGAAFAFREAARALAKIVAPGVGSVVSGGVAFAATQAIGRAAGAYYIDGVDMKGARDIFRRARKEAEDEFEKQGPADL